MSIFSYDFMIRAFIVAALMAVTVPCIGVVIVLKRLSAVGEAASHSALAGIAFGLVIGINPLVGAILFSVLAVLSVEILRKCMKKYSEIAPMVVLSAGIGLTAVLSGFIKNGSTNLNSFLFGSIVAISDFEMWLTVASSVISVMLCIIMYKELFYITFDEELAMISGVPVGRINFVFMLLTALTVSVASRTVGALMVSSLLVIPVACAMILSKSYKQTMIFSIIFAEIFTMVGLFISYYMDLRPGGTTVLIGVLVLILLQIVYGKKNS